MASSSTQVITVNSTIPFPAEIRRLIYEQLCLGTVVTLCRKNSGRLSHHPVDVKAKHLENSGAGAFLASKDSQFECEDIMYRLTTWHFQDTSRRLLGSPGCGSFEAKCFQIVELKPIEDLGHFFPRRRLLPALSCLVLSSHFQDPLLLDEAPHLYDVAKLHNELRIFSFRVLSDGIQLLSDVDRRLKILCSRWCEYEPYTVDEEEGDMELDGEANYEVEEEIPSEGTEAEDGVRWASRWIVDADTKAVIRHKENITVECYNTAEMHCAFLTVMEKMWQHDEELGILEAEDVQNHVECVDGSEAEVETDEDETNDSETEEEE